MRFATPSVEIRSNQLPFLEVALNLGEMLPLRTSRFRKTVGEMKGDELCQTRLVAVWQISALVPSAKTLRRVFNLRTGRPLVTLETIRRKRNWCSIRKIGRGAARDFVTSSACCDCNGARLCEPQQCLNLQDALLHFARVPTGQVAAGHRPALRPFSCADLRCISQVALIVRWRTIRQQVHESELPSHQAGRLFWRPSKL